MRRLTIVLFICLFFSISTFADDETDIRKICESLRAQAKTEENLGHYDTAQRLLSIEKGIANNISDGRKAYVIRMKVNEGKYDEAKQLSENYIPKKTYKPSHSQSSNSQSIRENCEKKWGDDYSMIKYCIEKQSKAKINVSSYPYDNIRKNCENKWGDDYSMVEYCIKKQTDAKRSIYK